jgi:sugar phosphate isomerase/epimerase
MKIAYGTYALPRTPWEQAIANLAEIGYDGIELCLGPNHLEALPEKLGAERRTELRAVLSDHGLGVPAVMVLGSLYWPDEPRAAAMTELLARAAQLARDLGCGPPPVLAAGIGGQSAAWDDTREAIAEGLATLGELAAREDFVLAIEAHCGEAVDRCQRAQWLLEAVDRPRVRLHFDIVHFFLAGDAIAETVAALAPWTAHTHIMDAQRLPDGGFEFRLLGDGELDAVTYLRAMDAAGWRDFMTLEVSGRIWSRPDYDPWAAAAHNYRNLQAALAAAGVARG